MTAHQKPVDRRVLDLKDPSLLVGKAYVAGEWIDAPDGKTIRRHRSVRRRRRSWKCRISVLRSPGGPSTRPHEVQKDWARAPAKERSQILKAWYDLILANADDLALILTTEQGKPLSEAKGEVVSNAAYIEWFAEEAKRIDGDIIPPARARPAHHGAQAAGRASAPRSRRGTFPTA